MFKVPAVPGKIRRTQSISTPPTSSYMVQNVHQAANESTSSAHEEGDTSPTSSTQRNPSPPKRPASNTIGTEANSSESVQSTEMQTLFNTVIENNAGKMIDSMRVLMDGMLHDFWNTIEPAQQVKNLQNRLSTMQTDYERQINIFRRDNVALREELAAINGEKHTKSANMDHTLNALKLKMAAQSIELQKWEAT